jgi:1,6-anhydro-N-acetylmuramate kinase
MNQQGNRIRAVVGVMTGTSIDGLDASLAEIRGCGLSMSAKLRGHLSAPLGDLAARLRAAADQRAMSAGEFARLSLDFGTFHAAVIQQLLESANGGESPDLICVHGQTVYHQPPVSWQLINPTPISEQLGCPVVYDLRQADLAAGGQGAPITPLADWVLFRHESRRRAIVNLGGYCNVTILPAGDSPAAIADIAGFDVCACNQILDAVARLALNAPFDDRGHAARRGRCDEGACRSLLAILEAQRAGHRSLGTGDEAIRWVRDHLGKLAPNDLARSASAAIGHCIGDAVGAHDVDVVIAAGGGTLHDVLLESIAQRSALVIRRSDELDVPVEARESLEFAILGALCADGVPITLPAVTGCGAPAPIAGTWIGHRSRASTLPSC